MQEQPEDDEHWIVFEGQAPPMSEVRRRLLIETYKRQFPAPSGPEEGGTKGGSGAESGREVGNADR